MKRMKSCVVALSVFALCLACTPPVNTNQPGGSTTPDSFSSPADLSDSGATSYPTDSTEATGLFNSVLVDFKAAMSTAFPSATPASSSRRLTETKTTPISYQGNIGSGTVNISGSATNEATTAEAQDFPQSGTFSYMTQKMTAAMSGTFSDIQTAKYTMSGRLKYTVTSNMNLDLTIGQGSQTPTMDIDLYMKTAVGYAFSAKDASGKGAKFLISWNVNLDKKNLPVTGSDFMQPLTDQLKAQKVTLKVYRDDNSLICEAELALADIPAFL